MLSLKEQLELAILIATEAHKGQKDKGGNDYIKHPKAVAERVDTTTRKIVAWLHDVVEDTPITLEELRKKGFSERILQSIDAVTRRSNENRKQFIKRASLDADGIDVKIADIEENSDLSRIPNPTEKDIARTERYQLELKLLRTAKSLIEANNEQ